MKETNKWLVLIVFATFSIACSSDDGNEDELGGNGKFIKSRVYTNLPSDAPNYDEFYTYEDGLLQSASGFTHLYGTYTYGTDGRLISRSNKDEQFTYEYDNKGRISKQNEVGTDNYIALFYEGNKVITHRLYEVAGVVGGHRLEKRELLLDNKGRIIKMTDLAPEESSLDVDYEIYDYDSRGNITKVTWKPANIEGEIFTEYEYEDIKNTYYYSLQKYYKKTYFLEFFAGLHVDNRYGLTPHLIKSYDRTYEVNDFNYPTKEFYQSYSEVYEMVYEYFD